MTSPKLLAGGNPQIAKGDGDGPVQAYIAAMPGWKSELGRRLDALVMATVPTARKGVRWNSPFYGSEVGGWFVSFHVLTKYVKVTFFDGLSLASTPLEQWKVKKDGGRFDQFAGATITPRAVVRSVLQALQFQVRQAERLSARQQEKRP